MHPKIKICGITRPEDALLSVEAGAQYLGLNFFSKSPRYIDLETARSIVDAVRGRAASGGAATGGTDTGAVTLVGVFVNHPRQEVEEIASALDLDLLQFSGDEGPEEVRPFGRRALKVFRPAGEFDVREFDRYPECWGFLFDRAHKKLYGGTGESWSYERVAGLATSKPVFVAGGVRPGKIEPLLKLPGIYGLDICSGVESAPGIKDPALIEQVFSEVAAGPSG